ncbi:hypothetical protein [Actinoplanes sp. GCM10030250]|uniref:hypothetical protein n=1 Tax=Actinoplanes sp. GCM10030250 TaxID=3273376 RepID=UPI003620CF03
MSAEYDGQQYVGIDLHRRRSVIVRTDEAAAEVIEESGTAWALSRVALLPRIRRKP